MCCGTKSTHIHFIDGKCNIKQLKSGKSYKPCLTNHTRSIWCHWLLMSLGADAHTDAQSKIICSRRAPFITSYCILPVQDLCMQKYTRSSKLTHWPKSYINRENCCSLLKIYKNASSLNFVVYGISMPELYLPVILWTLNPLRPKSHYNGSDSCKRN